MAEKYSRWTDKQTGINPFVAATTRKASPSIVAKIAHGAAVLFLGVPRMLMCILLMIIHSVFSLLFTSGILIALSAIVVAYHFVTLYSTQAPLIVGGMLGLCGVLLLLPAPLSSVPLLFRNLVDRILITAILTVVGVSYTVQYAEAARIIGVRRYDAQPLAPFSASPGDVILCNHTNILEIYALYMMCHPMFAFPSLTANGNVTVASKTFFASLLHSVSTPSTTTSPAVTSINSISSAAKKAGQPVVLFVEGVRSNGDGVLLFPPEVILYHTIPLNTKQLFGDISDASIHFAGFIYADKCPRPAPPCSIGSAIIQLLALASTLDIPYPATLSYLHNTHVPKQGKNTLEKWRADIRNLFAKMLNKNTLNLGMKDYVSFCAYYNALASGDESTARQIADTRAKAF